MKRFMILVILFALHTPLLLNTANATPKEIMGENDLVEDFVDNSNNIVRNIAKMDELQLKTSFLSNKPWTDDYWAIKYGILGARYADASFPFSDRWSYNRDYIRRNPPERYLGSASTIRLLSPSEKYDLLVADPNYTLTQGMWQEGQNYANSNNGNVESWMGICHGWAPASYMLPTPRHMIIVRSADNRYDIPFYPADIKALGSLLWANAPFSHTFIGGRCNQRNPSTNGAGRSRSTDCRDTNAGTWHMAVVNQIGVSHRSFIMDVNFSYEVWNQPVYGYTYNYMNPVTKQEVSSLQSAIVPIQNFSNDPYRAYRNPRTRHIVGINMIVSYISEYNPTQSTTNEEDNIPDKTKFSYDLELDDSYNIIGGEWYSRNNHPDFLWTPVMKAQALGRADEIFATMTNKSEWDIDNKAPLPDDWASLAKRYSSREKIPMAAIVNMLFRASQ